MKDYQLLVDVWEGQLDVDESVLRANGVAGLLIRLNDINGGHHKDENFERQWSEAAGMARAPYFVYNPWATGQQNYDWLRSNVPAEARAVMIDIEVRKDGYPAVVYAAEVRKFVTLAKARWRTVIYTGEWFLSYLSEWPRDVEYWWAQYPYAFYPDAVTRLTWDEVRAKLAPFTGPSNAAKCPGPILFWQISGDRLIMPGSARPIDVNVFFGSRAELDAFLGGADLPPALGDVTSPRGRGVTQIKGTRYGQKFSLLLVDMAGKRAHVTNIMPDVKTPSWVARETGALIVTNGDGWNWQDPQAEWRPYGLAVSSGEVYRPLTIDVPPWLNFTIDNRPSIGFGYSRNWYNAFSGFRLLDRLDPTKPEHATEQHPRSLYAIHRDGRLMHAVFEGRNAAGLGVTLIECRDFLLAQGANPAMMFDADGGGSAAQVLNGERQIVHTIDGAPYERAVINHLVIFEETSMAYGTAKEVLGKTGTVRTSPEAVSGNDTGRRIPAFATIEFVRIVDGKSVPTDKWFELPDGNYLNYILGGRNYYQVVTDPTPEPPPPAPTAPEIHITSAGNDVYPPFDFTVKPR